MMTTTAAKMAFRRKDLGWRGSGDAIVIVVVVFGFVGFCFLFVKVKERSEEMREESYYFDTGVPARWHLRQRIFWLCLLLPRGF